MLKIDGFGIGLYRSFGEAIQYVGPLAKVNLVIGQNNSGKSNILRFAVHHLRGMVSAVRNGQGYSRFNELDNCVGTGRGALAFAYGLDPSSEKVKEVREKFPNSTARRAFDKLLESEALVPQGDLAWFVFEGDQGVTRIAATLVNRLTEPELLTHHEWSALNGAMNLRSSGDLGIVVLHTLHAVALIALENTFPEVAFVPAIREVQTGENKDGDFSGRGLIERLANLQNPSYDAQGLKNKFDEVNRLLRDVTGFDSAAIEVPAKRDTILVHLDGRTLPLDSLGTGIQEVVILASAATVISNHLVCIEEPEIHLHPLLQRKLLNYLQTKTDNQYLIATHSSHFLDTSGANILHVRLSGGRSSVKSALTAFDKFDICTDLGYKASDLLQANCIIWVEGPSDRIYLRHWIEKVAPDLVEGFQYSIMFYGGRLLSHLSAEDPEVKAFISLRRLNRYVGILIDSDRAKGDQPLSPTKMRVLEELASGKDGFSWVTAGREIENYILAPELEKAVRECHHDFARLAKITKYGKSLRYYSREGKPKVADKVKVACNVVNRMPSLDVLDLRARLEDLVSFIKAANRE